MPALGHEHFLLIYFLWKQAVPVPLASQAAGSASWCRTHGPGEPALGHRPGKALFGRAALARDIPRAAQTAFGFPSLASHEQCRPRCRIWKRFTGITKPPFFLIYFYFFVYLFFFF